MPENNAAAAQVPAQAAAGAQPAAQPQAGQLPAQQQALTPQQQQQALYAQQQQAATQALEKQKLYQALAQVDSIMASIQSSPLNKMSMGQAALLPTGQGSPLGALGGLNTLYGGGNSGLESLYGNNTTGLNGQFGGGDPTQALLMQLLAGGQSTPQALGYNTPNYGTPNPYGGLYSF